MTPIVFYTHIDKKPCSIFCLDKIEQVRRVAPDKVTVQYVSGRRVEEQFTSEATADEFMDALLRTCRCPKCCTDLKRLAEVEVR